MDFLLRTFSENELLEWEVFFDDWMFYAAMALFAVELLRLLMRKLMTWRILGDAVTNFITLIAFIGTNALLAVVYIVTFYFFYEFALFDIPVTGWSILLAIVLADLAYYFEHRFTHRVGIGWATHTVHHSSPYFNISVAYRFGPLDSIIALPFYIPLVLLGFNPVLVFFAEVIVQLYQTLLHTEIIKKLPRPIEAIMNTPSHHRVHHGSNEMYLDKNYGGVFIIWDRLFGTFAREEEKVVYGITEPIHSINPFVVFFHGITRLYRNVHNAKGIKNKLAYFVKPPGWRPNSKATSL